MVDDETGSVLVQVLGNFGVVADRIGHDDVAADGEILETGGDVDGGTEVVETVVEGHGDAGPVVNPRLEAKEGDIAVRLGQPPLGGEHGGQRLRKVA